MAGPGQPGTLAKRDEAARADLLAKQMKVVALRDAGGSWAKVAKHSGYSRTRAVEIYAKFRVTALTEADREAQRRQVLAEVEEIIEHVKPWVVDPAAAICEGSVPPSKDHLDAMFKALAIKMKTLGTDAPKQTEVAAVVEVVNVEAEEWAERIAKVARMSGAITVEPMERFAKEQAVLRELGPGAAVSANGHMNGNGHVSSNGHS